MSDGITSIGVCRSTRLRARHAHAVDRQRVEARVHAAHLHVAAFALIAHERDAGDAPECFGEIAIGQTTDELGVDDTREIVARPLLIERRGLSRRVLSTRIASSCWIGRRMTTSRARCARFQRHRHGLRLISEIAGDELLRAGARDRTGGTTRRARPSRARRHGTLLVRRRAGAGCRP